MSELRKYNAATTILFPLIEADAVDFQATITFVAADVQIMKDEGAFANTTNLPVHEGGGIWSLALTAAEMSAARIVIRIVDAATKVIEDQSIIIETYGNAGAQHAFDLDAAEQTVALSAQGKLDVNAEADTALGDYDGPTKAEMDSAHALLATPAQVNTEVDNALDTAIPGSPTGGSVNDHVKDVGNLIQDKGTVDDTTPAADDFKGSSGFNSVLVNFYSQMLVVFTSGVLAGQARLVFSYAESTRRFGFLTGFSTAPANGDSFMVLSIRNFGEADIADAVWDEQRSGHVGGGSFGEGMASVQGDVKGFLSRYTMRSGTCQAGSTASTIKLDASASGTDDQYNGLQVWIYEGTGFIQSRLITDYVGATKVATISPDWTTAPDATSKFIISPWPNALSHADEVLKRPISNVEPGAVFRTLYGLVASGVNKREIVAGPVIRLYKSDDTTVLVDIPITEDSTQDPISVLDPP